MRKHQMACRSGIFEDLFAERQVYLRSGLTSHYVVLSRPLQIGVTVAMGLIVAWLAWASYSAIARHLELAGQSRELARLEEVNRDLRAAAEAAATPGQLRTQADRAPELGTALAAAEAARGRAEESTRDAVAAAAALSRQLTLVQDRIGHLTAARQPSGQADGTTADAAADVSDRLAEARGQIDKLTQALTQAQAQSGRLGMQLAEVRTSADRRVAELGQRADASETEANRLRGDLDAARKDMAALRQSAQTADLASLGAQAPTGEGARGIDEVKQPATDDMARLRATLASAQSRIALVTADLEAAKGPAVAAGPVSEPAAGANSQTVIGLQAELEATKQRIAELQSAIQEAVSKLVPLPPPRAPR